MKKSAQQYLANLRYVYREGLARVITVLLKFKSLRRKALESHFRHAIEFAFRPLRRRLLTRVRSSHFGDLRGTRSPHLYRLGLRHGYREALRVANLTDLRGNRFCRKICDFAPNPCGVRVNRLALRHHLMYFAKNFAYASTLAPSEALLRLF